MIKYVKQKDLDVNKYDACIEKSIQSRVYAFSWFLNIVADSWDVLVYKDYEAVLPIPYMRAKRYLFQKKIIQPFFCQQLGVFSQTKNSDLELAFYNELLKKKPKVYNFNSDNSLPNFKTNRVNYELFLDKTYKEIFSSYRKDRKHRVNQSKKNNLDIVENQSSSKLIEVASFSYNIKSYNRSFFKKLSTLIEASKNKEKGFLIYVKKEEKIVGGAFFLIHKSRIINLFSAFTSEGKKSQAPSFILDYVINKYSEKQYILDFEGSMIDNIASFFKSFGAHQNNYHKYLKEK